MEPLFISFKDTPMKLLNNVVRSWLELFDQAFYHLHARSAIEKRIKIYLEVITTVLEHYPDSTYMIIPVVMYADKYVREESTIHKCSIFF